MQLTVMAYAVPTCKALVNFLELAATPLDECGTAVLDNAAFEPLLLGPTSCASQISTPTF